MSSKYDELWRAIVRPPRDTYDISELGNTRFRVAGTVVCRKDFELVNKRGHRLFCSHWEPEKRIAPQLPCVIYMHGNCSSRVEACTAIPVLLPQQVSVVGFDFSGCGKSEGQWISLGHFEKEDLAVVVDHLRGLGTVGSIGLWGRSMGAATALLYAVRDPSIAGMVLDSPFSSLRQLAEELVGQFIGFHVPKFLVGFGLSFVRKTIQKQVHFDIDELAPIDKVANEFVPALFVAAKDDPLVQPHHSKALHDKYAGDRNLVIIDGDHNSRRPQFLLDSIGIFFHNTLRVADLDKAEQSGAGASKSRNGSYLSNGSPEPNSIGTLHQSNSHSHGHSGRVVRPVVGRARNSITDMRAPDRVNWQSIAENALPTVDASQLASTPIQLTGPEVEQRLSGSKERSNRGSPF